MMTALALSLAYTGLAGLCLAMQRHQRQVWHRDAGRSVSISLRAAGWLCLACSLSVCIVTWGGAIGPVTWFGMLSAAGLILTFLLPYAPRIAATAALIAPVVTAMSIIVE